MKKVIIYTDGACRGNPGPGGFGALLCYGEQQKKLSGAILNTTNNRMELMAAIEALSVLRGICYVDLYTDSQYLKKGMTEWLQNWKKKNWKSASGQPVKNIDLWQRLEEVVQKHEVHWHWVKGHSNHPQNDLVDQLANEAIDKLLIN